MLGTASRESSTGEMPFKLFLIEFLHVEMINSTLSSQKRCIKIKLCEYNTNQMKQQHT